MTHKSKQSGFSPLIIIIIVTVALVLGGIGYYVLLGNNRAATINETAPASNTSPKDNIDSIKEPEVKTAKQYLSIKEWNVQVMLPVNVHDKLTYSLDPITADPDGNNIQAVKILLSKSYLADNKCATKSTDIGDVIETGAQYIRSELSKPFNTARYRWTFKESIYRDSQYAYHLNFVTPDCINSADSKKIEEIQTALSHMTTAQLQ